VLTGWGRTAPSAAEVVRAIHPDTVELAMADAVGSAASGGEGSSPGVSVAATEMRQNAGVWCSTPLADAVHQVDLATGHHGWGGHDRAIADGTDDSPGLVRAVTRAPEWSPSAVPSPRHPRQEPSR